ncbi:MAG TPA: PAS domain S-box protein, partial [Nakamurella sp.]
MSGRSLLPFLRALASTVLEVLTAERPDPVGAYRVGAALVDAHFTEVDALRRTVAVLHSELITGAAARPGGIDRLGQLLGQLTAGYAQGLQNRTRAEQEQITAAAFEARVAAEQARWNSEARLEAVFADSIIGIAIAEIDGTIVEVNRALCDMLGFSAPEILSRTFWQ